MLLPSKSFKSFYQIQTKTQSSYIEQEGHTPWLRSAINLCFQDSIIVLSLSPLLTFLLFLYLLQDVSIAIPSEMFLL